MTEMLFHTDSYLKEFDASVIEVNEHGVVLDKTAFYPSSGGQPFDTGFLKKGADEFSVVNCSKKEGKIIHSLEPDGIANGDIVHGMIDWGRRYRLMKMHTAAHILSQIFYADDGAMITGNQLDIDKSRIDMSLENFDIAKIEKAVQHANLTIEKDIPITVSFLSREEALKLPAVTRLAKGLPDLNVFRIVSIGDFDVQADGGTHVKSTKEIGKIVLLRCDNKGKNNRRIYFTLE